MKGVKDINPIDWPAILADLSKIGVTHAQVASYTGKHIRTIDNYAQGHNEPSHSTGELILVLHRMHCVRSQDISA